MSDVQRLLDEATPLPWALNECPGTDGGAECWRADPHQDIYHPDTPDADHGVGVADIDGDHPSIRADAALIVYAVNRLPDYEAAVDALERITGEFECIEGIEHLPHAVRLIDEAREALARLREKVPA